MIADDKLLAEQAAYYRVRASEYDEWWQRVGRYDRGDAATRRWHTEVAQVETWLIEARLAGDVLELASGTGWWTERLARIAGYLMCIDASPETVAINQARITAASLKMPIYKVADLFEWEPVTTFDAIFFSFWLSHVPPDRFAAFWAKVAKALRPGGRVFFIDSAPEETASAHDHRMPDENGVQERRLNDGSTYRIIKLFHDPEELTARLAALGWNAAIGRTPSYFIHGKATRASRAPGDGR